MSFSQQSLDSSWELIRSTFPLEGNVTSIQDVSEETLLQAIKSLQDFNIGKIVVEMSMDYVWEALRKDVVPRFWKYFTDFAEMEKSEGELSTFYCIETLNKAVEELHESIIKIVPLFSRCERVCQCIEGPFEHKLSGNNTLLNQLKIQLRSSLHSQMPFCFPLLIQRVYSVAFKSYCYFKNLIQDEDPDLIGDVCSGCNAKKCICEDIISAFTKINSHLRELELLKRLAGSTVADTLFSAIDKHVETICRDSYDQRRIQPLEKWLERIVVSWLRLCHIGTDDDQENLDAALQKVITTNLEQAYKPVAYHKYTSTRISQLFNIVIEFPDSQPALEDIRECLEKTNLRPNLVESIRTSIQTRLLHPGVNTVDIIHAYISAVKALRTLDPSGILLELVSEPIRQYLRGRNDFVRYIVTNLTDDTCSELFDEMLVAAPLVLDDSFATDVEDITHWETWNPDPSHAQASIKSKSQRTADIVSMLVNIYGSKDVFINEYRTILADRILSQFCYDTEKEIRYLEHLKVRFGETLPLLHKCEVMVKDVADSKRINSSIQSDQNPHQSKHQFPVSAMILSAQFWPSFKEESLQLPPEVLQELSTYTNAFQDLKGNRTLNWKHHLGQVQIEIELESKTVNLTVTPIQATVFLHFEKKPKWTLEELSRVTLIPKGSLKRKLSFWQAQGLIQESVPDVFTLIEDEKVIIAPCEPVAPSSIPVNNLLFNTSTVDEETESVMASAQDQRQEELQVLWSYIVGMLTNLDALSIDRIHSFLKNFIQDSVECSIDELRAFLDAKCRNNQLVLSNGVYKLSKL